MQYVLLIYEAPDKIDTRPDDDDEAFWGPWRAYHRALVESGVHLGGNPLKSDTSATTVRIRDGQRQVQDGPYADTKEQLGGYILLELPSLDAALEWAARCPAAKYGSVEVRPVDDLRRIFSADSPLTPRAP